LGCILKYLTFWQIHNNSCSQQSYSFK
jgi:hypothetical protein